MHISLILDELKHQISFLEGSGSNPAAMVMAQILLVYCRMSHRKVTLLIQHIKSILTCFFIISFT